jgi:hypothetical protein
MRILSLVAAVAVMAAGGQGSALAQGTGGSSCACLVSAPAGSSIIGTLISSTGKVYNAGFSGFQSVAAGAKLGPNAVVRTGPASSAILQIGGSCSISMGANAFVSLTPTPAGICVTSVAEAQPESPSDTTGTNIMSGTLLAVEAGSLVIDVGTFRAVSR